MAAEIPRPKEGDVVDLILRDHRLFEELLRLIRDETQDRAEVLGQLAQVLVAHSEAEEQEVYPQLRKKKAIDADEVEHSTHEHDEANEALLELLEVQDTTSDDFGEAVHELSEKLSHHIDEEERDVLNPARTDVDEDVRTRLGAAFASARIEQMDADCGSTDNVRRLVDQARGSG